MSRYFNFDKTPYMPLLRYYSTEMIIELLATKHPVFTKENLEKELKRRRKNKNERA